jgi:hypothetical protein
MEILKKNVLKEMEEKSRNNLNRGIDIAVSVLKHEFPFITGWDYKDKPETYRSSIYLVLMADMNLASEFYNSPIRNVYRHSEARVAYPFSPLEISTELNEEEKYELYEVIQKSLIEIYDEIPSELRHEFESYASEIKIPKELYIDGFVFEKPKEDINENKRSEIERNLEAINLILSEISWDGLCEIWVEYNEVDGDYEIRSKSTKRHFDYDNINNELGYLDNTLRSMGLRTYIYTPWYVENCEDEVEFLNESEEETTNYIPIIEEIIEPFKNEDCVCEINVWYDEEDDMYSVYLVLGTEELNGKFYYVDGIRTYRNKLARKIETEIKSYLPIDNLYVGSYGKPNCGWKPLNENWYKVPSSDYNSLEKIINLTMKEKYWWWKDIKINTLNYIELYGDVQIEAELTVDEEWGANQWREFYPISEFPSNKGWEDNDDYRRVSLGDIMDSTYAEVIRNDLREIFKYTLNIDVYNMSFRNVYLIFE